MAVIMEVFQSPRLSLFQDAFPYQLGPGFGRLAITC